MKKLTPLVWNLQDKTPKNPSRTTVMKIVTPPVWIVHCVWRTKTIPFVFTGVNFYTRLVWISQDLTPKDPSQIRRDHSCEYFHISNVKNSGLTRLQNKNSHLCRHPYTNIITLLIIALLHNMLMTITNCIINRLSSYFTITSKNAQIQRLIHEF